MKTNASYVCFKCRREIRTVYALVCLSCRNVWCRMCLRRDDGKEKCPLCGGKIKKLGKTGKRKTGDEENNSGS